MKTSELIVHLTDLIDKHDDLNIIFDCDSIPVGIDKIDELAEPYSQLPESLISPLQDSLHIEMFLFNERQTLDKPFKNRI